MPFFQFTCRSTNMKKIILYILVWINAAYAIPLAKKNNPFGIESELLNHVFKTASPTTTTTHITKDQKTTTSSIPSSDSDLNNEKSINDTILAKLKNGQNIELKEKFKNDVELGPFYFFLFNNEAVMIHSVLLDSDAFDKMKCTDMYLPVKFKLNKNDLGYYDETIYLGKVNQVYDKQSSYSECRNVRRYFILSNNYIIEFFNVS